MLMESCKQAAAEKAASMIEDGMSVGLGSGSTAAYFIKALAHRYKQGLKVKVVASSSASHFLAEKQGLPFLDLPSVASIDLYVDGADEIDPNKQMIKGAGGALLREKILAHMSREMIVIVDETKLVSKLGSCSFPVEIIPFGIQATLRHLHALGYQGELRHQAGGLLYLTDNQNYVYDIQPLLSYELSRDHDRICAVPGVIETGFFPNQAGRVVIGFKDGSVVVQ